MKLEVLEQKKNPLMKRQELWVSVEHAGKATPPRKELLPQISKQLKSKEELIIIDKIFSTGGKAALKAKVLAYSKKEDVPKEKREKMERRMKPKEKKPAPEPEKPAEKPKEEPKPEEKAAEEEKPAEKPAEEEPKEEAEKKPEAKEKPKEGGE